MSHSLFLPFESWEITRVAQVDTDSAVCPLCNEPVVQGSWDLEYEYWDYPSEDLRGTREFVRFKRVRYMHLPCAASKIESIRTEERSRLIDSIYKHLDQLRAARSEAKMWKGNHHRLAQRRRQQLGYVKKEKNAH